MNGIALICPEWTANKSESSKKAQLPKNEENVLEMQPIENADVNATDDEIQVDYLEKIRNCAILHSIALWLVR